MYPLFKDWLPVNVHTFNHLHAWLKNSVFSNNLRMFAVLGSEAEFRSHVVEQMVAPTTENNMALERIAIRTGEIILRLLGDHHR